MTADQEASSRQLAAGSKLDFQPAAAPGPEGQKAAGSPL